MEVRRPGGFCVVASTVACFDVRSDFVALRRRLGADGAVARQRRFGAGGTDIPGSRGQRDAGSKRRGAGGGATAPASDHSGHRAQAEAGKAGAGGDPGGTSATGDPRAPGGASATDTLRDRRSQRGRRNAGGAAIGEPDDDLGRGP